MGGVRPNFLDLTGHRFGRLVVESYAGRRHYPSGHFRHLWNIQCDCGVTKVITTAGLRSGGTQSCGCLVKEMAGNVSATHRCSKTREYRIWSGIKERCLNPRSPDYENYGARGIRLCKRWHRFENFIADMGIRPSPKHSIERIKNERGYSPSNCRWATAKEQCNNKRNNVFVEAFGLKLTPAQWVERVNVPEPTLRARVFRYGWTPEDALTVPVRNWSRRP